MKPKESFGDWYLRTRGRPWDAGSTHHFADGLVEYVEEAVGRLDAAVDELKSNQKVALDDPPEAA